MSVFRIAITPGEPAGIGYDLVVQLAQMSQAHELTVFGDESTLCERAKQLALPLRLKSIDLTKAPQSLAQGEIGIVPIAVNEPVIAGQLNAQNAPFVLRCLDQAITACQSDHCHAMVTGPVQKSIINDAGIAFSGHTEYLQEKTNRDRVVMMLATEGLRVALATTHLPISDVAAAITTQSLTDVIRILNKDLQKQFGIAKPRILVCGLNPHAGEGGHLGREEIETIIPTLEILRGEGIDCIGPLPADTLFTPKYLEQADAVLAMYHDQGLPVLKYKGFGQGVNITLGLPIIRTSVDHGTALDMAGSGKTDVGSLATAIRYAEQMLSATKPDHAE